MVLTLTSPGEAQRYCEGLDDEGEAELARSGPWLDALRVEFPWLEQQKWLNRWIYPRNLLQNYGTSPFIVDFPMKNCDFP